MPSEPEVLNLPESNELKRKVKIRGGHKAAFTRLETKVDDLIRSSIFDEETLCIAEALLSNLKTKATDIHRWDTEVQLEVEEGEAFNREVENATDFDLRSSITIARLTSLINNYKKQVEASGPTAFRMSSSGSSISKMKLPKLNLPTFSGSYTDWMSFIELFRAAVDSNGQLTRSENLIT